MRLWPRRPRYRPVIVGLESTIFEMETGEPVGSRATIPFIEFRSRAEAERWCAERNAKDTLNLTTWVVEEVR